ncbi:MAG: hypothetical protein EXQ49_06530 [Acidobacteria bacterium]|nr:hypothetical protein [Acidobacteriota bacterium]
MRPIRKTILITAVALGAAVVVYIGVTLPSASRTLAPVQPTTVFGAFHVHTNRSDGSGSPDDVARAAAAANLQFVVLSDHGDATRTPDPPFYRHGVLMIDAVEISTTSGHVVALGLTTASPFPLGGEARDTIEDVHRMGGWAVIAHPDSPKPGLRWRGDTTGADGLEWLNADSEWRDESPTSLARTIGHYLIRPSEAIAGLFDRPTASLERWDTLARERPVVALAGVDAHARVGVDGSGDFRNATTILARPSYLDMFGTVLQGIELSQPLTQHAADDAGVILSALRSGRTYSVVRAIAWPGRVSFTASHDAMTWAMGESVSTDQPVTLQATAPEPDDAIVVLLRGGEEVASGQGSAVYIHNGAPASYRAEVRLPGRTLPWVVTNAIRVGSSVPPPRTAIPALGTTVVVKALDDPTLWAIERHEPSTGELTASNGEVGLAFSLAPGRASGQYAAMAYPLSGQDRFDAVTMTLRAEPPMRVSIQWRVPRGVDGDRWQRSVYVDATPRTVTLDLQDFAAVGEGLATTPSLDLVRSLSLVVDTWHTRPGSAGRAWISGVSLVTSAPSTVR